MSAKITVIVPVFNVTDYVEECLLSLVNQTLKDIEIIVVDDCGTDDSIEKVKNIASTDSRIRIIHNETNQGLSESRNVGLRHVSTPYVAFLDSDDYVAPDFYEKLYLEAKKTGADIAVGKAMYYYENSGICREEWVSRWNFHTDLTIAEAPHEKQYNIYACACWDKIYKTSLFIDNEITFPKRLFIEDVPITFITVALANKLVLVRDAKIFYRQRPNSIMKNLKANRRVFDIFAIYKYADALLARLDVPHKDVYNKILDNFKIFNIYGWSNAVRGELLTEFNKQMKETFGQISLKDNLFITPESRGIHQEVVSGERIIGVIRYRLFGFFPILKIVKTSIRTSVRLFNNIPLLTISRKTNITRYHVLGIPVLRLKVY